MNNIALSPLGGWLATGNPDGTVYVFKVPSALPERDVGEVRPVEKGENAPDLSRAKRLHLDTFADPNSGFGQDNSDNKYWGYDRGKYFFKAPAGTWWARARVVEEEEYACELQGRVTGDATGAWGLYLHYAEKGHGVHVLVNGEGKWEIAPSIWEPEPNRGPYAGPVAHRAIKPGKATNKLLVVVRRRRLEIYINDEAVCEPVILDRNVSPGEMGLLALAKDEPSRIELQCLTIWSAKDLPAGGGPGKAGKP